MTYKTCTHLNDDGNHCESAAATHRDYCVFHLRHRARLLRLAQTRARNERFDLKLPPLESMHAVQSALTQLAEALAADMIDLKRADRLLAVLRLASRNLLKSDQWLASPFHSDQPGPAVDLAAEYGLPPDLDLATPPEVAFPPPPEPALSDLSSRAQSAASAAGVEGPAFSAHLIPPSLDRAPLIPEIPPPIVRDYYAEIELAMNEVTPQDVELNEILHTQGLKAMDRRAREHQRNDERRRQRKLFRANYERYVAQAKTKNIQRAAEKLIADKLAAEKAAAAQPTAATNSQPVVPPAPVDCPTLAATTKKPPTPAAERSPASSEEAQKTA